MFICSINVSFELFFSTGIAEFSISIASSSILTSSNCSSITSPKIDSISPGSSSCFTSSMIGSNEKISSSFSSTVSDVGFQSKASTSSCSSIDSTITSGIDTSSSISSIVDSKLFSKALYFRIIDRS